MSDQEQGQQGESGGNGGDAGASSSKPKRTVHRKPLWLAVPKEYGDTVGDDGEIVRSPLTYELYECEGKEHVMKVLKKLGIDVKIDDKSMNPGDVKIFRADPIPLTLETQTNIKF